ncbi:MAG TPA: GNAT family N-acetyltransferase [Acidobacteriaceae bacterium]|jgi:GNAT superfamily N-acetyltransferase
MSDVIVREFQPADAEAFFELNREWIQRYFWLEPADLEVLWHPQTAILDCGGRILMAVRNGVSIGCCALIAIGPGEYELAKMAVTPAERRHGIGRRLIAAAIALAERIGATRLYLETNHTLTGAIALYESMGFQHLPARHSHYSRADVFMERMVRPALPVSPISGESCAQLSGS